MMKKLLLGALFFVLSHGLLAQNKLNENEYFFDFYNGQKLFVRDDSLAQNVSIAIVFNCGAFLEDEDFDGMSFLFEKILAERVRANLDLPVYSETSYEYVFLSVTAPASELGRIMHAIYQGATTPIDTSEVRMAANLSNQLYQELYVSPEQKLDSAVGSLMWGENFSKRVFISYWTDSAVALIPERLSAMIPQYFCPGNSLLIIDGNINGRRKAISVDVTKVFENWKKCTINLFARFAGYNYKTVLANAQLIVEDNLASAPFYRITFQGPPPFEEIKNNFCTLLLSSIFENPDSKLHRFFKDSCHTGTIILENDMRRFLSQITFTLAPDSGFLGEGIECFRSFLTGSLDSLIDDGEMQSAKERVILKIKGMKSNNRLNVFLIAKYWKSLSLDDYHTMEDTIDSIAKSDMQYFLDNYLRKHYSVAGLFISPATRDASGIDSVFTPTATSISAYRLQFLKNSALFASADDDSVFNSLVQFLKLNPQLTIKVHGICHESELPEIEDAEMRKWISDLKYFVMNPPSLVIKKKFRLDVYRSLTVIKKLVDAGISKDRLFGTANKMRFPEEPENSSAATFYLMLN